MSDRNVMLNEDNYFVWEFNTRLKLMKKGLLDHIDAIKTPIVDNQVPELWRVNDLKAFAIILMSIGINLQSSIRNPRTASEVCNILQSFHLRRNIHNRVQKKKELLQFKLVKNGDIMHQFQNFDNLCLSMEALDDGIREDEKLAILLRSLLDEYDQISKIIGNIQEIDVLQAKEMLRREFEGL
uniref:Putative polyprotein n=1 Tax=Albugo laibachii Nc14 TaxID=890382 RepID=F0W849_9STRA|nr:putative polyprotein [Albugo laibachii Nc14]|eukprot:CCA17332.1 putative polyprotein [Albugo laibachii Nc14]